MSPTAVSPSALGRGSIARPRRTVLVTGAPDQLALARELAARWLPRLGRRRRRRLGAGDVLAVMRAVTNDPEVLAATEIRFMVEELLSRGRKPDGQRVTREDLIAAGLAIDVGE